MVTQLLPLEHANCKLLSSVFQPLVAREGILLPYEETNTLIITDMASNVERIVRIIGEIDIPGNDEVEIFALGHAEAESLGRELIDLYQSAQPKGKGIVSLKIIPDKRTNSLIVRADPEQMKELQRLVAELDRKQIRSREGIHIYPLENAVAEDLASVLMEIPGKGGEASKEGVASQSPVISKDVQISADKATNSLVIIAEPEEFEVLQGIISRLDIPRTMVYVEALIVEASATRSLDLGVEWLLGNEYNGGFDNPDSPGRGCLDGRLHGEATTTSRTSQQAHCPPASPRAWWGGRLPWGTWCSPPSGPSSGRWRRTPTSTSSPPPRSSPWTTRRPRSRWGRTSPS